MRYKLIADVEGDVYIPGSISIKRDEFEFFFIPSNEGRLTSISISMPVPSERVRKLKSTIEPGRGLSIASITIGDDSETHEQLVRQLQMLESNLAFSTRMALQRINWDTPKQEYIPDSPEDEELLAVRAFTYTRSYDKPEIFLQTNELRNIVISSPKYDELNIAKAFWREGKVYFYKFQYVQAFYQFYFIIEDFFSHGKSGEKPVLKEFSKSSDFNEICKKTIQEFIKIDRHQQNLERLFNQFQCEFSVKGMQKFLYKIRGNLHHYSSHSIYPKGTPYNQKDFESVSFLIMYIVTLAIYYKIAHINQNIE